MRDGGLSAQELRSAGFTLSQLRQGGFTVKELRQRGRAYFARTPGGRLFFRRDASWWSLTSGMDSDGIHCHSIEPIEKWGRCHLFSSRTPSLWIFKELKDRGFSIFHDFRFLS
jgi:hypothetical protein